MRTNSKNYDICDNAIAIVKEESKIFNIINIHPIITSNNDESVEYGSYTIDSTKVKKICYSRHLMDCPYSARFISLSKDGNYLAISWLPNPTMGQNISIKYCMIYDLREIPYGKGICKDENLHLTIPIRLLEFSGGCSFTPEGSLVLINYNEVRIYILTYPTTVENENFELSFSLNLSSANASLTPCYNYDQMQPAYFLFPLATNGLQDVVEPIKNTEILSDRGEIQINESPILENDFFYDDDEPYMNEKEEEYEQNTDEQDKDEQDNNEIINDESINYAKDDTKQDNDALDDEKATLDKQDISKQYENTKENTSIFDEQDNHTPKKNIRNNLNELYEKNNSFIKMNIYNIKHSNVICCISNKIQDGQASSILVWSITDKKLIHSRQLTDPETQYITAFTEKKKFIAVAKKYDENKDITRPVKEPVVNVYDCEAGNILQNLYLPENRSIAGISQVSFLQKDDYIMALSFGFDMCFIDIWDTGTGIHMDCFSTSIAREKICIQDCQVVLHDSIQLRYGCGLLIQTEFNTNDNVRFRKIGIEEGIYQKVPPVCNYLPTGSTHLILKQISFFDSNYNHDCGCGSSKFWKLTKSREFLGKHSLIRMKSKRRALEGPGWCAYFLNEDETALMTCTQRSPYVTPYYSDDFIMTVWDVTPDRFCRRGDRNHKRTITLNMPIYSFIYTINSSIDNMVGYPASFLDLKQSIHKCILHINPIIVKSPSGVPILLMKINDACDSTNYCFPIERDRNLGKDEPHTIAIPLCIYSMLECHLNFLASGSMINRYSYENFARIPDMITDKDQNMNLEKLADSLEDDNLYYFGTLTGYSTLCRLVKYDRNYSLLEKIFKPTTIINYCSIVLRKNSQCYVTDVLKEALLSESTRSAKLIVSHIKKSISTSGFSNGSILLVKNYSLLVKHGVQDIF